MKNEIQQSLKGLTTPLSKLEFLAQKFEGKITFSTSFGLEDQVITHLIFTNNLPIQVFTLDTGRNFQETYNTWENTLMQYKKNIAVFFPATEGVENLVRSQGINGFYESVENRKACCYVRKVAPLRRALQGQQLWVTGIRAEQSANRQDMSDLEWDESHKLLKFHPLFDWTFAQTKSYADQNGIPYNPLHNKGFLSIGCAPCTRAIRAGEDFRAGRWWWEDATKKECGLHAS